MLFHFIARRLKIFRFICNGLLSCSIRPAFWQSLPSLGSGQADHAREEYPQGNEIDTLHNYFEAWLDKLSESYTAIFEISFNSTFLRLSSRTLTRDTLI